METDAEVEGHDSPKSSSTFGNLGFPSVSFGPVEPHLRGSARARLAVAHAPPALQRASVRSRSELFDFSLPTVPGIRARFLWIRLRMIMPRCVPPELEDGPKQMFPLGLRVPVTHPSVSQGLERHVAASK